MPEALFIRAIILLPRQSERRVCGEDFGLWAVQYQKVRKESCTRDVEVQENLGSRYSIEELAV